MLAVLFDLFVSFLIVHIGIFEQRFRFLAHFFKFANFLGSERERLEQACADRSIGLLVVSFCLSLRPLSSLAVD